MTYAWFFCFVTTWCNFHIAMGQFEKEKIEVDEKFVITAKTMRDKEYFAHVACDSEKFITERSCYVSFGKWSSNRKLTVTKICNFTQERVGQNVSDGSEMKIELIRENEEALVAWAEAISGDIYHHFRLINIPKCTVQSKSLLQEGDAIFLDKFIVYKDGEFEVVASGEDICKWVELFSASKDDPRICSQTSDTKSVGTVKIEKLKSSLHHFRVAPVFEGEETDGFLAYGWTKDDNKSLMLQYISKSGRLGKLFRSGIYGSRDSVLISTSTTFGRITLCTCDSKAKKTTLSCHQYINGFLEKPLWLRDLEHPQGIDKFSVTNYSCLKFIITTVQHGGAIMKDSHLVMKLHNMNGKDKTLSREKIDPQCEDFELKNFRMGKWLCSCLLCTKKERKNVLKFYRNCIYL